MQTEREGLGQVLRRLREERGLASLQAAARYFRARALGVSYETLRKYELGISPRSGKPIKYSVEMLEKIARGYDVPLALLLGALRRQRDAMAVEEWSRRVREHVRRTREQVERLKQRLG